MKRIILAQPDCGSKKKYLDKGYRGIMLLFINIIISIILVLFKYYLGVFPLLEQRKHLGVMQILYIVVNILYFNEKKESENHAKKPHGK